MENLLISCFSLAKSNNGFFKSEKQAEFLISKINERDGNIGSVTSGYNSCPVFANLDNKGILKIVKSTKSGEIVMFERVVENQLNSIQIKEINSLEKLQKKLEKELLRKRSSFNDGSYNGTGDSSTYSKDLIERYLRFTAELENRIISIDRKISAIKLN